MKCDIVRQGARGIVSNYMKDPKGYEEGLRIFYAEGTKNPSVARIIYHDEVINNAKERGKEVQQLLKEYDSFKPSEERVTADDFKPRGITQMLIAESAADLVNTVKDCCEELAFKYTKIFKLESIMLKIRHPLRILDHFNTPEGLEKEKEAFDTTFDTLYPRTGEVRKKLIQYNIRQDRVTPRLPKSERHLLMEPGEDVFQKYPELLENKDPKKPSLSQRIKNAFKSKETLKKEEEAREQERIAKRKEEYLTERDARALKA